MRTAAEILADRPAPRTALSVLQAPPDLAERIAALAVRASNPEGHNQWTVGTHYRGETRSTLVVNPTDSDDDRMQHNFHGMGAGNRWRFSHQSSRLFWAFEPTDEERHSVSDHVLKKTGKEVVGHSSFWDYANKGIHASGTSAGAVLGWGHRHQWQPAHPENDPPGLPSGKIKHAVLVIGGRRAKGASHWQAFLKFSQDFPSAAKVSDKLGVKEGFETESGHFLTRNQAALYVGHHDNALTSEAAEDADIHLTARDGQLYTQDAVQAAHFEEAKHLRDSHGRWARESGFSNPPMPTAPPAWKGKPNAWTKEDRSRITSEHLLHAAAWIEKLPTEHREDTEFSGAVLRPAAELWEARKKLPKDTGAKFRKVTESYDYLSNSYDYIANVNGTMFGLVQEEDPDDEERTVWAYERLDDPKRRRITLDSDDNQQAYDHMRKSLEPVHASARDTVQAASPKFGCLMAMTPELAGLVQAVADQIRPEDLAENGVETEPHVTVLYGFNLDFDSSRLEPLLKQAGPITLRLGKVERFECPEYDVIKFGVQSPDLVWLNSALTQTFAGDISPSKWDYNPHVTIAYVKKGACKDLASPSEGLTLTMTQLLYSLPDRQGRRTFDVVHASTPQTNHAHSVVQDEAQAEYEEGLKKAKEKKSKAALLLLLLSLGVRAYLKAYAALARLENVPLGPNLRREAVRFAKGRKRFLKPFVNHLHTALNGPEASPTLSSPDLPADLQRRVQVIADTEAQAVYGQAQLRVLQRAGYTTKNWVTVGDDRVRESHVKCEAQRDIPLGDRFANGLLYPGDPAGGPEEVCNCRCWLEGGSKRPVVTASHVREHLSHSKTGKEFVVREHDTKHVPLSEKAQKAKDAHHLIDRKVQRYAEEHNEPAFARAVGGVSFRDNEPVDVVIADETGVVAHGIELKTVVSNKAQKITMKEDALRRKRSWERKNKATIHTVVLDDTQVFNANGEGKHDLSKRRIFYRRGYGSFRISNMHQVANLEELKSLLDTPRRSLPKGAR